MVFMVWEIQAAEDMVSGSNPPFFPVPLRGFHGRFHCVIFYSSSGQKANLHQICFICIKTETDTTLALTDIALFSSLHGVSLSNPGQPPQQTGCGIPLIHQSSPISHKHLTYMACTLLYTVPVFQGQYRHEAAVV